MHTARLAAATRPRRPLSTACGHPRLPLPALTRPAGRSAPRTHISASSAGAADAWEWAPEGDGNGAADASTYTLSVEPLLTDLLPEDTETRPAWLVALHRAAPFLASRELRARVMGTLSAIALVRLGAFVPLPGVSASAAAPASAAGSYLEAAFSADGGLPGAVTALALGVGPAVNASWLVAGAALNLPYAPFRRAILEYRQGGREGEAELRFIANGVTAVLALVTGWRTAAVCAAPGCVAPAALTLAVGAMAVRYVADWIEDCGLGDGISLMICVSVLTGYGATAASALASARAAGTPPLVVAAIAAACIALVAAGLAIIQLEIRLPLVSYRRRRTHGVARRPPGVGGVPDTTAARASAGATLPLRLAPSGMSPLLMASLAYHILPSVVGLVSGSVASAFAAWLARPAVGCTTMAAFILLGEAVSVSGSEAPKEMADWMASAETGLVATPPGEDTERELRSLTAATRMAGASLLACLYLAAVAVDALGRVALGGSPPGAVSLLLAAGFVTSSARQVASLVRLPQLADTLAAERRVLRKLLEDGET